MLGVGMHIHLKKHSHTQRGNEGNKQKQYPQVGVWVHP
ncbi:hypothetical protein MNB_SUP05-SYMBIONT-5-101 [hydrothermal vent metagenome]|uniref:Uncharacterized protein n=1 Tax=hydrothermal vent metagenome TaxID=652676 RepID=A0A1W1E0H9_9ZZZZ